MKIPLFSGTCDATTAAHIRRQLRNLQSELEVRSRVVEDMELAATELVTNAVNAGAHWIAVELVVLPPSTQVDVTDDAPELPQPQDPNEGDTHGRGLQIVAAIADEWGYYPQPRGKTVWATFAG
jgi:anti-sigma regulatory factor (Ser/Thr protein kinase)